MADTYWYIGGFAFVGALVAFVDWVTSLPVPDYDDTEFPNEEDE